MGVESWLRTRAHRAGLENSRIVVAAYQQFCIWRVRGRWEEPVEFRGAQFSIGRDLSLYPAVRNGGFEAIELDTFLPEVRPGDTVWDVGGNIGIYAVLLGRAASTGHVVSFEPVTVSRERLLQNIARNGLTNVTVEPVALSDREGSARMAVHANAHGCDHIELDDDGSSAAADDAATGALDVQITTGEAYAESSPHGLPDAIKVDIEGHEPEFLDGTWSIITKRQPTLMLEVNPTTWRTQERVRRWDATLRRLLETYGHGTWIGPHGSTDVDHIDVSTLSGHAYALILRDPTRA